MIGAFAYEVTVAKNSTDTRLAENPVIVSFWKLLTVHCDRGPYIQGTTNTAKQWKGNSNLLMEMGKVEVGRTLEVMHLPRQSRFRRAWPTWFLVPAYGNG